MTRVKYDSELKSCTICSSPDIKFYTIDYKGVKIFECNACKTQFINPQYTDEFLLDFYSKYQDKDFKHHRYGDDRSPRLAKHKDNLELIEKYRKPGTFFSIGSGNGIDMEVARSRGWTVEGYEIDEDFTKSLSSTLNVKMYSGDFVDTILPTEYYDCVYMNHVIEHPKNPGAYLSKIVSILKEGGVLYLATPNISSASIRLKKFMDACGLRSKKGSYYDTWQHLTFYEPQRLAAVLENKFGFSVLHLSNDVKKIKNGKVKNTVFDKILFKSGFRLLAIKN